MPNWCENSLTITGENEEIRKFKEENTIIVDGELTLSFNLMVTLPQEEEDNWYDWHVTYWGTKWDLSNCIINDTGNILNFNFDTAWSPPENWVIYVSPYYPNLSFELKYAEAGMGFSGRTIIQNGTKDEEEYGEYGDFYGEIYLNESDEEYEEPEEKNNVS